MPYTDKQCRLFASMEGGRVRRDGKVVKPPNDWKQHCKGKRKARNIIKRK